MNPLPPDALATETSRLEWKESGRDTSKILRAVCALANDLEASGAPGHVLIGVDRAGDCVGLDDPRSDDDVSQEWASQLSSTRLLPHPSCDVTVTWVDGKRLLVIRVEPYPVPPLVAENGVPWVRVGTTTRRATDADRTRLMERRPERQQPFDIRPVTAASLDDLDLDRLRDLHRAQRTEIDDAETFPPLEDWLGSRDLARRKDGRWMPTAAGLLIHGLAPQAFVPGATVEFVRYAGRDFDAPVRLRKTITGTLPDQLDALWTLLALTPDRPDADEGIRQPYRPDYPLEALRELARNMIQHRLYEDTNAPARLSWLDDCIVLSNPGGPYGHASQGEFGSFSDYRNPTVTRLLAELGYVERLGRGIRVVRSHLARNGNPPLQVETDGYTTVIIRNRS